MSVKTTTEIKPIQTDIAEAVRQKRLRRQEKCHHDFIYVNDIDFENDRVVDRFVCRRCGYEEF